MQNASETHDPWEATLASPLNWWRKYRPNLIFPRKDDLLSEVSTASRGLIDDALINAVLGGNRALAVLAAERLRKPPTLGDLPGSWLCWAASSGERLAASSLMDALAHRSIDHREERSLCHELICAWQLECPLDRYSISAIQQSVSDIETFRIGPQSEEPSEPQPAPVRMRSLTPTLRVLSAIGDTGQDGGAKSIAKTYEALLAPLSLRGGEIDLEVFRVVLLREFPWMWTLVEDLVAELRLRRAAGVPWLRLAPRLLVGPPGIGKTRFARRLAQLAGTGYRELSAAGSSDNRLLMGTARGWESTQPALPLLTMRSSGAANPVIVVDEIDKTRSDGRNGDIRHTLLTFLEDETARAWFDECLLAECDLSQVSWILTANATESLPSALLSRLQLIHVERPSPLHFDATLRSIIGEFAHELGVTASELPELAPEAEKQLAARFARTASVRELKHLVRRALATSAELLEPVLH